mgnify:FL=1
MADTFKCCKNKPNNNWICIVCHNLYHPGCWKRTKNYTVINENWIWCSEQCANQSSIVSEDTLSALQQLVNEKTKELESKNEYIKRLKRQSTTFEGEAAEMEAQLVSQIESYKSELKVTTRKMEEQKEMLEKLTPTNNLVSTSTQTPILTNNRETETIFIKAAKETRTNVRSLCEAESQTESQTGMNDDIDILRSECAELKEENTVLWSNKNKADDEIKRAKDDLSYLQEMHREMLDSLRTIEADNKVLSEQVALLKSELPRVMSPKKLCSSSPPKPPVLEVCNVPSVEMKRDHHGNTEIKRVSIYGDQSCRGWASALYQQLDSSKYKVFGLPASGSSINSLKDNIFTYSKDFTCSDCVIISLDLRTTKIGHIDNLKGLLSTARFTNVILVIKDNYCSHLCKKIYNFVSDFNKNNRNLGIRVIENYRTRDFHFRYNAESISNILAKYLLCQNWVNRNICLKSIVCNNITLNNEPNEKIDLTASPTNPSQPIVDFLGNNQTTINLI